MTQTLVSTPQLRAAHALAEARKARHHKDCRCRMFKGVACSPVDAMFTARMNRALEEILRDSQAARSHRPN